MVSEGKTEARPNFISRFTYKERVNRNGGSCENLSKQASKQGITLPFFLVKPKIEEMIKAYSAHVTVDGMRLYLIFSQKNGKERIAHENETNKNQAF